MERFAIKIDKKLKANLYKICRLCGIDNPDMVPIISDNPSDINKNAFIDVEAELEMQQKINLLLGLSITKDDRMPQTMCCLCVDKINDFYEFREMCYATNLQTRKLLGLKNVKKPALDIKPKVEIKEESIVPTPIPAGAPALNKNNKKRKSEEVATKDEKPDITTNQPKKKLRFSSSAESNIKEEVQTKKKLRFSATTEELSQPASSNSKKLKNVTEDTKLKKEPSPPVPAPVAAPVPLSAVSNKKLRLAAPPQKESAIKKSKQKTGKNMEQKKEAEVKEEIKEEVKEEPAAVVAPPAKVLPIPAKVPAPPKLKFGCNICKERFPAKVNLETHKTTHVPKVERYVCTACNEILSKGFDIKNHQLWHKLSKTPYICGCCGQSILNTYAFSRHLREHTHDTPPALLVLDRECPQCHTSYATNFLYNIHVCAVKTRRCAGCNRLQRNDAEYLKHSAQCAKVYLNYSKHIMPSVEALEDAVRIKNENDVEAAAEEMARIGGVSLDMAPVVQLTRLSSPLIMAASQAVSSSGLDDATSSSSKKSGKKGVSKKELKRVDELLKSTLDALVSIKHEPEVHVDQETPNAGEHSENEDRHETDDLASGLDDHHQQNEADDENEKTYDSTNAASTTEPQPAAVASQEQVKIKQEVDEINEENANKIGGGLKLKIKKEHGQLNSSIIEQQKSSEKRADKRKKKKKHKEKEKDKMKLSKDTQDELDTNINNNSSEENIDTSTIRIKVEPEDGTDFGEKSLAPVLQHRPQPEATIMTSIPMMQFQIACVSSGVEFNNTTNPDIELQNMSSENHDAEPEDVKPNREELDRMLKISHVSSGFGMETDETEENVAEGMDHDGNYDKASGGDDEEEDDYHEGSNEDVQHGDEMETDYEEDNQSENPDEEQKQRENELKDNDGQPAEDTEVNKKNIETKKIKKLLQPKPKLTLKPKQKSLSTVPKSRNKACKSTAKPPNISTLQISAVQSGVNLESTTPTFSDFTPIFIKPEPQNRGYSDEQTAVTIPTPPLQPEETEDQEQTEDLSLAHTVEEQNYISTIDFNNIMIKQEKDIEITDVQITQKSFKSIAKTNGLKRRRKQMKDKNLDQNDMLENNEDKEEDEEEQASDEEDEGNDSDEIDEEEEEEADEEEDEEMDEEDENEEREYRELEYPPGFSQEKNDPENDSKNNKDLLNEEKETDVQETSKEKELKASFVIANVCSQASNDSSEENFTKISEQNVATEQVLDDKDTNVLTQISDQEGVQPETIQLNSDEKTEENISTSAATLYNLNIAQTYLEAEVPNTAQTQTFSEASIKNSESHIENTHSVVSQTLQTAIESSELSLQLGKPFEIKIDGQEATDVINYCQETHLSNSATPITEETRNIEDTHSNIEYTPQSLQESSVQLLQPEAQLPEDVQSSREQSYKPHNHENLENKLQDSATAIQDSDDKCQLNLENTPKHTQDMQSTSQALLENIPYIHNSEVKPQPFPTPLQAVFEISSVRTTAFTNSTSEVDPCLQSNNDRCEVLKDNQKENDTATVEGVVQESKVANLEAHPVTEHFDNETVDNDENEEDYNEDIEEENELEEQADNDEESTLSNNLEERQNYQNQEVLSQIKPTALALHPYLEDISSSSNSLLSNSLSQTPPPLQFAVSATGDNNNLNSQRRLNTEETDNILNESNEVAETSAMSLSHSNTQPILGQPLPPQMPTFNFDNINEIAENNNNANIEREQLQDEQQHQHQHN